MIQNDKLEKLLQKFQEIEINLQSPDTLSSPEKLQKLGEEHKALLPIHDKILEYKKMLSDIAGNNDILENEKDEEIRELAKMELSTLQPKAIEFEETLKLMLLPKDPRDNKNVIIEVRAGTGGDEAGLFASELLRMYLKYAENRGWKSEILSQSTTGVGGIKEVTFLIKGYGAFSRLKFESGTHRVQRVPVTETSGRIHTSAATVAVLPEAQDVDIDIKQQDLRVDVFRSSGNGGQSVNTTDSAVRITHLPTNTVVTCQDEKSQLKNKNKAMSILRSRLYALEEERLAKERGDDRKNQVGSGDRSEKIRTYNYPQDRVTDHRIGLSVSGLPDFINGNIDRVIEPLIIDFQTRLLSAD